jgi:hypothetical protein
MKRNMMHRPSALAPFVLLSLAHGCGSEDDPGVDSDASATVGDDGGMVGLDAFIPGTSDAGQNCRTFVSDSLIQHACFHELMGPHAERTASADAVASGVEVNRAHTSFRVRLPARPQGGFGGVVTYQARFAGAYAIFARGGDVRVSAQDGPVTARFEHDTQICAVLPAVSVYSLAAQSYALELSSAQADVVLVIESMDEGTVADAYRTDCTAGPRPPRDAAVFALDASFGSDAAAAPSDGTVPIDDAASAAVPMDGAAVPADDASAPVTTDSAAPQGPDADSNDAGMCVVDPVLEHSCLHAMHGPFEAVLAADLAAAPPDISRPHTAWRMTLPATSSGRFAFRPNMEGEYVFYLDRALPLQVSSGGVSVMPTFSEPVTSCVGISEARVFPLTRATRYDVSVGPVPGDAATVIIESVQAFTSRWSERYEPCP